MAAIKIYKLLSELLDTNISGVSADDFLQYKGGAWTNRTVAQVKTDLGVGTITLSGDVSGSGTTSITTTIGAGKVTNSMLAGSITAAKLVGTDIDTVGTITTGTWSGTTIAVNKGGTGQTTAQAAINALMAASGALATGDIFYYNGTNVVKLAIGSSTQVLTVTGGVPVWAAASGGGGSPGGSNTQLQYNNSSAFGGISGATTDGTNVTYGTGNLRATSPRITTSIADANGNPWLTQTATGSAVLGLNLTNAIAAGTLVAAPDAAAQITTAINGAALTVRGGVGTAGSSGVTGAIGGALNLIGGAAATSGSGSPFPQAVGGAVNITGGAGAATGSSSSNGGAIVITGGAAASGATGGAVTISAGDGTNLTGSVTVVAFNGTTANTIGSVTIGGGTCSNASNGVGAVTIQGVGRNAGASTAASGAINITTAAGGPNNSASGTAAASGALTQTIGTGGAESGNTAGTGGAAGAWSVAGGKGGNATGAGGTHTGGAGTTLTMTSGAGGDATGASGTRTGGNSGDIKLRIGAAGTGASANGSVGAVIFEVPTGTERLRVSSTAGIVATLPVVMPSYTVATVPSAATFARGHIWVSDESGGATGAQSDGTNWRRYSDRAIIS